MDLEQIKQLTKDYQKALNADLEACARLEMEKDGLERYKAALIAEAYRDGTIDGKNDRVRKAQEAQVLIDDIDINELEREVDFCAGAARSCESERKAHEAYIGLVKAWLYSQSGIK